LGDIIGVLAFTDKAKDDSKYIGLITGYYGGKGFIVSGQMTFD